MILVYKKDNQKRISWKRYSPIFTTEINVSNLYVPEVVEDINKLIVCVVRAHNKKLNSRHYFENKLIKKLEEVSAIIEAKEGFNPNFIKEG